MKTFLLRLFTWWNGQTFGTQWWTWLYGEFVGEDEFGNRYFRTKGGKIDPTLGFERRWVIYRGIAEASTVPPSWHGWLHHTVDVPPTAGKREDLQLGRSRIGPISPVRRPRIGRADRRWRRAAAPRRPATTKRGIRAASQSGNSERAR